jgi:hypothetical protein
MKKFALLSVLPLLCLMIFPNLVGALGFEGIGGKVSLVLPDGDNTIGFGAIASLGTIVPSLNALKAEVGAEYWGNSNVFFNSSVISLNGTAKYYFATTGMLPFAGAGLGLVRSSASAKSTLYGGNFSSSSTDLNIHFLGGIELPIGANMKFIAEGRYVSVNGHWLQISGGLMVKL